MLHLQYSATTTMIKQLNSNHVSKKFVISLIDYRITPVLRITRFFISNTFISNVRLKLAKNQTKTKQHAESELLLFQNYLLLSSTLSPKKIGDTLENIQKTSTSV